MGYLEAVYSVTRTFLPVLLLMFVAARASGQDQSDPSSQARVHIGPLALSPAISLTNAGVDNNVFNEPSDASPKSDFTMTVQPKVDLWLHLGRSLLIGNVTEDLVYYHTYSEQRSANNLDKLGLLAPLTRITFRANVEYLNTNDRPGFEIDLRPHRTELTYDGAVELRLLSKTFFGVRGARQKVDYDATDVFQSANLQTELNRTVTSEALTVRHQLTTLTSLTFEAGKQHDRFEFNRLRDADSTVITGGVLFDPFALLKGSAKVGYRDFEPVVAGLPSFKGTTVAVDLSYIALGSTKVTVNASRDINYSFDVNQPYYVQTGGTLAVTQQIFGPVDVVGRVGAQRLDYRDRSGAVLAVPDRTDHVHSYGVGIGYHLGSDLRVGFNVDQSHRTSAISDRQYDDLRYGTAVTYGF
jgi:putative beta-barrel porin BBP2